MPGRLRGMVLVATTLCFGALAATVTGLAEPRTGPAAKPLDAPPSPTPAVVARDRGPSRPGPVPAPASPAAMTPAPPARTELSLAFTGDTLLHGPVNDAARIHGGGTADYGPMFDEVRPVLSAADLALCHLEVPLSADGDDISSYPSFNAPPEIAAALAGAGYDGCSVASNHAIDQGERGVVETLETLDRAGLGHTGTARDPVEARAARIYQVNGWRIGHVSATYGLNGLTRPPGSEHLVDLAEPGVIIARATAARQAGADLVVASLHWGAEERHEPTPDQVALAERLTTSGKIDLIVGHHAHVIQPIERVNGIVVAYGLGNFLSNQTEACCAAPTEDGVILEVTFSGRPRGSGDVDPRIEELRYSPTWVEPPGYVIRDIAARPPGQLSDELTASWARTAGLLGSHTTDTRPRAPAITAPAP